jgi:hypothetical protein
MTQTNKHHSGQQGHLVDLRPGVITATGEPPLGGDPLPVAMETSAGAAALLGNAEMLILGTRFGLNSPPIEGVV